ncbi:MAG: hypothetical protein R3B72_32755 [Polyangiaceae bacterium]
MRGRWVGPALALASACSLLAPSDEELGGGGRASTAGGGGVGGTTTAEGGGGMAETCVRLDDATLEGAASLVFRSYLDVVYPTADGGEGVCEVVSGSLLRVAPSDTFGLVDSPSGSGLSWKAAGAEGVVSEPLDGLRARLHGAVQITVELVVDVSAVAPSPPGLSQLVQLGAGDDLLAVAVAEPGQVLYALGTGRAYWDQVDVTTEGRAVLHVTYDASATTPEERSQLYVDGETIPSVLSLDLQGAIALPSIAVVTIGGTASIPSIEGQISYIAIYDDLLLDNQIAANVARLANDDDRP